MPFRAPNAFGLMGLGPLHMEPGQAELGIGSLRCMCPRAADVRFFLSVPTLCFPTKKIRPMRILIADDHEIVTRGVASTVHSRKDIEVCDQAPNGKEAPEKAREYSPDMIILDISMPVLDGFGAAKQIRTFLPGVPILFISMLSGPQVIEQVKTVGGL
jgi:CheY-like chemotaxis protein